MCKYKSISIKICLKVPDPAVLHMRFNDLNWLLLRGLWALADFKRSAFSVSTSPFNCFISPDLRKHKLAPANISTVVVKLKVFSNQCSAVLFFYICSFFLRFKTSFIPSAAEQNATALLWSSRNVLKTVKPHPTFHLPGGRRRQYSFLGELFL